MKTLTTPKNRTKKIPNCEVQRYETLEDPKDSLKGLANVSDIFNALEKYIFRDLSFMVGGSVLLSSVFYLFDKLPTGDVPAFKYFVWAGVSYAIGYSVQEVFTVLHLVRTKASFSPNRLGSLLFRLFDRERPRPVDKEQYELAKGWLANAPERFRSDHERIESLKQVGTALGPCFLLAGFVLLGKSFHPIKLGYVVAGGLIILGLILILLGWLKVTQQPQYLLARYNAEKQINVIRSPPEGGLSSTVEQQNMTVEKGKQVNELDYYHSLYHLVY